MPLINRLTDDWVSKCLSKIGIDASVAEWSLEPSRTNYYSLFPDSADWRDRWRASWTLTVRLDKSATPLSSSFRSLPIPFDDHDPTWDFNDYDNIHRDRYMLLFAARDADLRLHIEDSAYRAAHQIGAISAKVTSVSFCEYDDMWREARIRFQSTDAACLMSSFDIVLNDIRQQRFTVNWAALW